MASSKTAPVCTRPPSFNFTVCMSRAESFVELIKDTAPRLETTSERLRAFVQEHCPDANVTMRRRGGSGPLLTWRVPFGDRPWMDVSFMVPHAVEGPDVAEKLATQRLRRAFVLTGRTLRLLRQQEAEMAHHARVDFAKGPEDGGMPAPHLLEWKMGSGKTLGSLVPTLSGPTPPRTLLVVCSKTLIGEWVAAVETTRQTPVREARNGTSACKIYVVGYSELSTCAETLLSRRGAIHTAIIDEAQTYRNYTPDMRRTISWLQNAHNMFLLSGTPLPNSPKDFRGLLALMGESITIGDPVKARGPTAVVTTPRRGRKRATVPTEVDNAEFIIDGYMADEAEVYWNGERVQNSAWDPRAIADVFRGNVSYYAPEVHADLDFKATFPKVVRDTVLIDQSPPHAFYYLLSRGKTTVFDTKGKAHSFRSPYRNCYNRMQVMTCNDRDVLTKVSEKAAYIVQQLREIKRRGGENARSMVYSQFLDRGLNQVEEMLRGTGVRVAMLTGSESQAARTRMCEEYNDGKLDVIMVSNAGNKGTNLRGTGNVFLMEPHNNANDEGQTEARCIRLDSHPRGHRSTVRVHRLQATFPSRADMLRPDGGAADRVIVSMAASAFPQADWGSKPAAAIRKEVQRICEEAERGMTIDEMFEVRNQKKLSAVTRYLGIFHRMSIPMPRGRMHVVAGATMSEARVAQFRRAVKAAADAWRPADVRVPVWNAAIDEALKGILEENGGRWLSEAPKRAAENCEFVDTLKDAMDVRMGSLERMKPRKVRAAGGAGGAGGGCTKKARLVHVDLSRHAALRAKLIKQVAALSVSAGAPRRIPSAPKPKPKAKPKAAVKSRPKSTTTITKPKPKRTRQSHV